LEDYLEEEVQLLELLKEKIRNSWEIKLIR
jgi:hypothetical protein